MADYSGVHRRTATGKAQGKSATSRSRFVQSTVWYLLLMGLAMLAALSMMMCAAEAPQQEARPQFSFELPEPLEIPEFPELPSLPDMPDELRQALEEYAQP